MKQPRSPYFRGKYSIKLFGVLVDDKVISEYTRTVDNAVYSTERVCNILCTFSYRLLICDITADIYCLAVIRLHFFKLMLCIIIQRFSSEYYDITAKLPCQICCQLRTYAACSPCYDIVSLFFRKNVTFSRWSCIIVIIYISLTLRAVVHCLLSAAADILVQAV